MIAKPLFGHLRAPPRRHAKESLAEERDRMASTLLVLIDRGLFLPGSLGSLQHSGTHGITTIRVEHLAFRSKAVLIEYVGKNFTSWSKRIPTDDPIGRAMRANLRQYVKGKARGELVFTLSDGKPFTAQALNRYIRRISGMASATATMFRRHHATRMVRQALWRMRSKSLPRHELEARILGSTRDGTYRPGVLDAIARELGHRVQNRRSWQALVAHSVDPAVWADAMALGVDLSRLARLAR